MSFVSDILSRLSSRKLNALVTLPWVATLLHALPAKYAALGSAIYAIVEGIIDLATVLSNKPGPAQAAEPVPAPAPAAPAA